MDPDWAFETFCRESGFATAHGMSAAASAAPAARGEGAPPTGLGKELFGDQARPSCPPTGRLCHRVEPRAVGSVMVLAGAARRAWATAAGWCCGRSRRSPSRPSSRRPTVVAEVDPLSRQRVAPGEPTGPEVAIASIGPSAEALDRLYRPEALDVPVLVPRDGPIAALDPASVGALAPRSRRASAIAGARGMAVTARPPPPRCRRRGAAAAGALAEAPRERPGLRRSRPRSGHDRPGAEGGSSSPSREAWVRVQGRRRLGDLRGHPRRQATPSTCPRPRSRRRCAPASPARSTWR